MQDGMVLARDLISCTRRHVTMNSGENSISWLLKCWIQTFPGCWKTTELSPATIDKVGAVLKHLRCWPISTHDTWCKHQNIWLLRNVLSTGLGSSVRSKKGSKTKDSMTVCHRDVCSGFQLHRLSIPGFPDLGGNMSERSLKYNTGYPFALQMHASIHILHRCLKVPLAKFSIKPQENILFWGDYMYCCNPI